MLDLQADIVPGRNAAGFRIGCSISEVDFGSEPVRTWNREMEPLPTCIDATEGWLHVECHDLTSTRTGGCERIAHCGTVVLKFNRAGVLYEIELLAGYQGAYAEAIRIGSRLDSVAKRVPLFFDSGDDMHYPIEGSDVPGLAFIAEFEPLEERPDQVVIGFSVHDWRLRNAR